MMGKSNVKSSCLVNIPIPLDMYMCWYTEGLQFLANNRTDFPP